MSELTPELAPEVIAACEAGSEEAVGALGRSLDGEFTLTVGEAASYSPDAAPDGFDGPGLAIMMKFGDEGVTALLPETSGLLPDWYAEPDATGMSKMSTLAQELSMLFMPETMMADDFQAARVGNLKEALIAAGVAGDASLVPLAMSSSGGDAGGQMSLIWPLATPAELLGGSEEVEEEAAGGGMGSEGPPAEASSPGTVLGRSSSRNAGTKGVENFADLPGYSRSLLKIELPVRVVLAAKKENLQDIVELASGSILKFEKSCEELLHLQVEEHKIALGEAVKVGDKFGFRVSSIVMPDENFTKVQPDRKTA